MRKIYEYRLDNLGENILSLPKDSKVLSVAVQSSMVTIWAEVEVSGFLYQAPHENRIFLVFGTGQVIDQSCGKLKFIGTVFDRHFVWHVYERVNAGF